MPDSVQAFFDELPSRFKPDKAAGLEAVYQFDLSGDGGGQWHADISDGACTVVPGQAADPNITVSSSDKDFLSIVSGKLKVKGDMGLAMRLQSIFF